MLGVDSASTFEAMLENAESGFAYISTRVESYDAAHAMFYSPLTYLRKEIVAVDTEPDTEWVGRALVDFVRVEFGQQGTDAPRKVELRTERRADLLTIALALRDQYEQSLVFNQTVDRIVGYTSTHSLTERLYKLMCSNEFGSDANVSNISLDRFSDMTSFNHVGLRIVVPGLPFRDQNRFRTNNNPSAVTLAEVMFLLRLHCVALAVYQILPTGSDVAVLSDGTLYSDIFDVEKRDAINYLSRVRAIRNSLNISGTVSVVDLSDLIRIYEGNSGKFHTSVEVIERLIFDTIRSQSESLTLPMASLRVGIKRNLNTRSRLASDDEVADWLVTDHEPDGLPGNDVVEAKAVRYAALNLALRWHDVIRTVLPTVARGTMHPKPGQLALPRLGSCFPWNGVAIAEKKDVTSGTVQIHPLSWAARKMQNLEPVCDSTGEPIYYIQSEE